MTRRSLVLVALFLLITMATTAAGPRRDAARGRPATGFDAVINDHARDMVERGRQIFRFDTFGDQAFWGGQLRLHDAIKGKRLGGVGPGVSPKTALSVGLKVDVNALPEEIKDALRAGQVDLDDPATTLALLKLDAVVGVKGFFDDDTFTSMGITCAFCHSTVDDSFAPGAMANLLEGPVYTKPPEWRGRGLDGPVLDHLEAWLLRLAREHAAAPGGDPRAHQRRRGALSAASSRRHARGAARGRP